MKNRTATRVILLQLLAVTALLGAYPAHAHRCGPGTISIPLGQCATWEIFADVDEEQESAYSLPGPPGAQAVTVPGDPRVTFPFFKFNVGVYRICGVMPGSTNMTAKWAYAPNKAEGDCPLTINVTAASTAPGSNGDGTDSGEDGDPVNTFSGELFDFHEPDLHLNGPLPLVYQRYYSSQLARSGVHQGRLGAGWMDNFTIAFSGDSDRIDVSYLHGQRLRFERDGSDWSLASPPGAGFQLRQLGTQFGLLDPTSQFRYTFDGGGRLLQIRDRNDHAVEIGYGASGNGETPVSVSDGLGRSFTFGIAGFQLISHVSDGIRSVGFSQTAAGPSASHLNSVVDADGLITGFAYADPVSNVPGLMTSTTRPEGNTPLTSSYDGSFRVDSQTDAFASVWAFDYDGTDTTLGLPGGMMMVHSHDEAGRQTGIANNIGESRIFGYDGLGRRNLIVDELGQSQSMSHVPDSLAIASYTDPSGAAIIYGYTTRVDTDGFSYRDLSSIEFGDGRSYLFTRDTRGNLTGYTDPGSSAWSVTVDAGGQPLTIVNPLGGTAQQSYRADGMLATRTDAAGNTTSFDYDDLYRLQTVTRPGASVRSFTWTASDRLESVIDELGYTTSYQYDANRRVVMETDAGGNNRGFGYDDADRPVTFTDALGQTLTRFHDTAGRPQIDTLANGESVDYGYDSRGFLDTVTVPSGAVWIFSNDALGRIIAVTDPTGAVTGFEHDPLDRITAINWHEGGSDRFQFDAMGRLLTHTDAEDRITAYRRDTAGWLAGIDAGSVSLDTTFNALGLLEDIQDPNSNQWNWLYDGGGRLVESSDPLGGATTYDYDNRNRWSTINYPDGLGSESLEYDALNQLLKRDFSDGTLIEYGYDALGRLESGTNYSAAFDAEGRMTASNGLTVTRQPATGRIATIVWPGGPTITYNYDSGGRLASIDDGLGGTVAIGHDAAGRVASINRQNGVLSEFDYDGKGRLAGIRHGDFIDIGISRDHSGFVTSASRNQPTHYQVPETTLSQSANPALGLDGLSHDALGRVTADSSFSYTHDLASRLTTRMQDASTASYQWDALYHLVARSESGANEGFVWNYATAQPSVATTTQSGSSEWYYVSLPDGRLLYRIQAGSNTRQYFHFDEAGNTLALTDTAGDVVASYGYAPYGRRSEAGSVSDNPFTFGGEHFVVADAGQRLYVMGARLYDAERMRFVSRDRAGPALNPLAFNPYAYAAGNPLYFIDPWGDNPQTAGDYSALDAAGDIASAVAAPGTVQGMVEEAAEANLNGARQTTAQLGQQFARGGQAANQARGPLNSAIRAQNNAQRALNQATGRGMKAAGNVGNAATFLGGLIEAYKLHGKLGEHRSSWSRATRLAFQDAETASENAWKSYKKGNINEETLRRRLATIQELLESRLENENDLFRINTWISGADSFFNFGMGLAPGGDKLYSGLKSVLGVEVP